MSEENRKPQQGKGRGTVVVTGGAGCIGSHICKALAENGFAPVAYNNLCYGHEAAVKWRPSECGNIADTQRLASVFKHYQPEAVIYFTAFACIGESVDDPCKYYANNVAGPLNFLNAMRQSGTDINCFSSTCATYGIPDRTPIIESHPQAPINPYGRSKLMIEWIFEDYYKAYGITYVVLRYFNAAGADPDVEIGENHHPETHLIPLVLDVAMGRRKRLYVFGIDYAATDGTCIRDYIHVSDLADAHLLSLKHLQTGGRSKIDNLGNGNDYSVKEVIAAATRVTGREIPWQEADTRIGIRMSSSAVPIGSKPSWGGSQNSRISSRLLRRHGTGSVHRASTQKKPPLVAIMTAPILDSLNAGRDVDFRLVRSARPMSADTFHYPIH